MGDTMYGFHFRFTHLFALGLTFILAACGRDTKTTLTDGELAPYALSGGDGKVYDGECVASLGRAQTQSATAYAACAIGSSTSFNARGIAPYGYSTDNYYGGGYRRPYRVLGSGLAYQFCSYYFGWNAGFCRIFLGIQNQPAPQPLPPCYANCPSPFYCTQSCGTQPPLPQPWPTPDTSSLQGSWRRKNLIDTSQTLAFAGNAFTITYFSMMTVQPNTTTTTGTFTVSGKYLSFTVTGGSAPTGYRYGTCTYNVSGNQLNLSCPDGSVLTGDYER